MEYRLTGLLNRETKNANAYFIKVNSFVCGRIFSRWTVSCFDIALIRENKMTYFIRLQDLQKGKGKPPDLSKIEVFCKEVNRKMETAERKRRAKKGG